MLGHLRTFPTSLLLSPIGDVTIHSAARATNTGAALTPASLPRVPTAKPTPLGARCPSNPSPLPGPLSRTGHVAITAHLDNSSGLPRRLPAWLLRSMEEPLLTLPLPAWSHCPQDKVQIL